MITIFATPKPFRGHFAVIQRNAIRSWTLLRPTCDIILMGNEEGTAEIAADFRLHHVPEIGCNIYGTPLVSALFQKAQQLGVHNVLCYVNSDIILMSDFASAVQRVTDRKTRFLLVGRRWNVDLSEPLDFKPGWEDTLRSQVKEFGSLADPSAIDYFVFPRELWGEIPPFAIGRPRWDNWMLYRARFLGTALVDATSVVTAVHQNHDYSHHPEGKDGVWEGDEALSNEELSGGASYRFTIDDATHLLTPERFRRIYSRKYLSRSLHALPVLYPALRYPGRFVIKALQFSRALRSWLV